MTQNKPPIHGTLLVDLPLNPSHLPKNFSPEDFLSYLTAHNISLPNYRPHPEPTTTTTTTPARSGPRSEAYEAAAPALAATLRAFGNPKPTSSMAASIRDTHRPRTDLDLIGRAPTTPYYRRSANTNTRTAPPTSIKATTHHHRTPPLTFLTLPSPCRSQIFSHVARLPHPTIITPYRYFSCPILTALLSYPLASQKPFLAPLFAFCAHKQLLNEYRAALYTLNVFAFRESRDLLNFAGSLGGFPVQWLDLGIGGNVKVPWDLFCGTGEAECEWWVENAWKFWCPSGRYASAPDPPSSSDSSSPASSASSSSASLTSLTPRPLDGWRQPRHQRRHIQHPVPLSTIPTPTANTATLRNPNPIPSPIPPSLSPADIEQLSFERYYLAQALAGAPGFSLEIARGMLALPEL